MKHIKTYQLFEFVSQTYTWKWSSSKATSNRVATFDTSNDHYMVEFTGRDYDKVYKVSFESDKLGVDGSIKGDAGNAMRVLTTVLDIIIAFLDEDIDNEVTFIGAKGEGEENENPSKRDRVYKQMMDGLPDSYKWDLGSDGKTIHISREKTFEAKTNKPDTWYHGTDSKFDKFDMSKTKTGPSAFGLWFTDDAELATMFGENVIKCELSYTNPKVITMDQWDEIRIDHAKDTNYFTKWKSKLISQGHDALFVKERFTNFAGTNVRDGNMVAIFDQDDAKILTESLDLNEMMDGYKQGGIVLLNGPDLGDGTHKLYAAHIKKVLKYDRLKKGDEEGQAARMVLLDTDTYRIIMQPDGSLKAIKVMAGDKAAGLKSRNVVLNNDKTPSHWITAKHIYFPMMFNDIGAAIKALPDIKWN